MKLFKAMILNFLVNRFDNCNISLNTYIPGVVAGDTDAFLYYTKNLPHKSMHKNVFSIIIKK